MATGYHLILILNLILAWATALEETNVTVRFDADKTQSFGNLVHDVTEPLDNIIKRRTRDHTSSVLEGDPHTSSYAYYRMSPERYKDVPHTLTKYFPAGLFNQTKTPELGLIFPRNYTTFIAFFNSPSKISQNTFGIVVNIPDTGQSCQDYCFHLRINFPKIANTPNNASMKFGLELNARFMECFEYICPLLLSSFDILVFNVEAYPLQKILPFSQFEGKVKKLFDDNAAFVRGFNSKCQFYIRITMTGILLISDSERDLYRTVIANNAAALTTKWREVRIITDIFPKSAEIILKAKEKTLRINPYVAIYTPRKLVAKAICDLDKVSSVVGASIENVILEIGERIPFNFYGQSTDATKCNGINMPNLILKGSYEHHAVKIMEGLQNYRIGFPLKSVYVEPTGGLSKNFTTLRKFTGMRNISLGCLYKNSSNYLTHATEFFENKQETTQCSNMLESESFLFLEWIDDLPVDDHYYLAALLDKSLKVRNTLIEKHPRGKLTLQLHVIDNQLASLGASRLNIYCTPRLKAMDEFDEAVMQWSLIHNIDVILHPLIDTLTKSGWWFPIVPDNELNVTDLDYVLLVRRNSPVTTDNRNFVLPFTYPCIHWTAQLSNLIYTPINFDKHNFAGVTVNLNIPRESPLTPFEIQTMLSFAFGRFTTVEVTGNDANVEQISKALVQNLAKALPFNLNLIMEFTDVKLLQQLKLLNSSEFPPAGLHISQWERQDYETRKILFDELEIIDETRGNTPPLNFGITVQNCASEINSDFSGLKSLQYFKFIRYVVCVVKPIYPTNSYKKGMQIYLDTIFYIQQYFNSSLGVDVYFRLSFLPPNPENQKAQTESYLRFLADVNQHAEGYKIKYFFADAFASGEVDSSSWWRLANFNDLTNPSVYTELESDYFGRRTEQKYKVMPESEPENIVLLSFLSAVTIILVAGICGLWIYHRRVKHSILTKKEAKVFRNGEEVERKEESVGVKYVKTSIIKTLGFNKDFEIPKEKIKMVRNIGGGNFGEVWAGISNWRTANKHVAIKIPKDSTSKDSVLSLMDEARILGHLGSHLNVLQFIGAYTKEVEQGVIYLVTEFCENGSLEIYLRKKKPKPKVKIVLTESSEYDGYADTTAIKMETFAHEESVDVNELHRFACEIAAGMDYISGKLVTHSDLSARNVLLTSNYTCKIGDFGLSRKLYERNNFEYIRTRDERLPWKWMAPESLTEMIFTSKSDVWGFGVTLWEIYTFRDTPYPGISWSQEFSETLGKTLHISKPTHASDEIYIKMLECCNISPDRRPTFGDLAGYFRSLCDMT